MSKTELLTAEQAKAESFDKIENSLALRDCENEILESGRYRGFFWCWVEFTEQPDVDLKALSIYLKEKGYETKILSDNPLDGFAIKISWG